MSLSSDMCFFLSISVYAVGINYFSVQYCIFYPALEGHSLEAGVLRLRVKLRRVENTYIRDIAGSQ